MLGERMEAEIREQPAVLASQCARYASELQAMGLEKPELVLLVARGSSDHAALYARYLIEVFLEIPAMLAAPSVWTRYGRKPQYPRTLTVGISQSGAAPDVSEVLCEMREAGHQTLAITNTPDSRVTKAGQHALLLGTGNEESIAATKTYSASLLALYQLVRQLGADLPEPDIPTERWSAECSASALLQMGAVVRCIPLFALARGFSFATANETALKLMECALLPAKAYSTADFQHGPKALAGPGSAAIVFGGGAEGLKEQGCELVEAPSPPVAEPLRPIWEIFFGQWLALNAARARGLDPDTARNLSKVTETL